MTGVSLNDLYPAGAILKREYQGRSHKLWLWHFAYNEGQPILLGSWKSEKALDLAAEFWGMKLMTGQLPSFIVDKKGNAWERMWVTLGKQKRQPESLESTDDESEIQQ